MTKSYRKSLNYSIRKSGDFSPALAMVKNERAAQKLLHLNQGDTKAKEGPWLRREQIGGFSPLVGRQRASQRLDRTLVHLHHPCQLLGQFGSLGRLRHAGSL